MNAKNEGEEGREMNEWKKEVVDVLIYRHWSAKHNRETYEIKKAKNSTKDKHILSLQRRIL